MFDLNRADIPTLTRRAQRIRRDVIDPFADRMLAALRHACGGHTVERA